MKNNIFDITEQNLGTDTWQKVLACSTAAKAYAVAVNSNKPVKEVTDAEKAMSDAVTSANEGILSVFYASLLGCENPVLEAITRMTMPIVRKVVRKDKGTGSINVEVNYDGAETIDLLRLDRAAKEAGEVIFAADNWDSVLRAFAKDFARAEYESLGIDAGAYVMQINGVALSKKDQMRMLQLVVDSIIIDANDKGLNKYKARTYDVKYIATCAMSRSRALTIRAMKAEDLVKVILEAIHSIVTGESYKMDGVK